MLGILSLVSLVFVIALVVSSARRDDGLESVPRAPTLDRPATPLPESQVPLFAEHVVATARTALELLVDFEYAEELLERRDLDMLTEADRVVEKALTLVPGLADDAEALIDKVGATAEDGSDWLSFCIETRELLADVEDERAGLSEGRAQGTELALGRAIERLELTLLAASDFCTRMLELDLSERLAADLSDERHARLERAIRDAEARAS